MTNRAVLLKEIETLPAACLNEVVDFVAWLKQRKAENLHDDEIAAYKAMAADTEREQEASEWCNSYFGPANNKWHEAVYQIMSADKSRIKSKIADLSDEDMLTIESAMKRFFNLTWETRWLTLFI